jgi:predicted hydrolase (HD superfamily)
MSVGFGKKESVKISINKQEINNIIKKYKKAKKLMKSNLYQVQVMEGTESYISSLIQEVEGDPPDI